MKKVIPSVIALVQWGLTYLLQIDRLYFRYEQDYWFTYGVKLLYLVFLILIYNFAFWVFQKCKNRDSSYIRGVKLFGINFGLQMVILFLLWPGTWSLDDINVLGSIQYYHVRAWQHVLTNLYDMVLLQALPFPGGIIILQSAMISGCVATSIVTLERGCGLPVLKNTFLDVLTKLCPFYFPPVLMYQLSGYRMGIYIFLELLLLVILMSAEKKDEKWSFPYAVFVAILGAIICTWRTEGIIFLPIIMYIVVLCGPRIGKKQSGILIVSLIIGIVGITKLQGMFLPGTDYELITTARPCTELVRTANEDEDAEILLAIDQVISIDAIYDNPEMNGEELYWNCDLVQKGYTKEQYHDYMKALLSLGMKYPKDLVKERMGVFLDSIGLGEYNSAAIVKLSAELFDYPYQNTYAEKFQGLEAIWSKSWNPQLRKSVIKIIGMQKDDGTPSMWYRILWSAVLPIIGIVGAFVYALKKKKRTLGVLITSLLLQLAAIAIAEPGGWIMYVLATYMLGYIIIIYGIIFFMKGKK